MKRIAIIGPPASGKSTVALKITKIIHLPVYHLDLYFWQPGWKEISYTEFKGIHDQLIAQPTWIIEGCSTKTIPDRILAADIIIYLQTSRIVSLWRILKRLCSRYQIGVPQDRPTWLNWKFLTYAWNWNHHFEPMIMENLQQCGKEKHVFVIKNNQDLEKLLEVLKTFKTTSFIAG